MTTIHVQRIGDKALLPQREFERCEEIALRMQEDDVPTLGIMRLEEQSDAFDSGYKRVKIFTRQRTVSQRDAP